jgi:hypothetical protein
MEVRWFANSEGIKAGESLTVLENSLTPTERAFPSPVYDSLRSGLTASGLLTSEADAMIQTWWKSYFESGGLRVFWIVPRPVTDRILPLAVDPKPETIVRTLVGRSEVLRPSLEKQWLTMSDLPEDESWPWKSLVNSDRFGLAIKERIDALKKDKSASVMK